MKKLFFLLMTLLALTLSASAQNRTVKGIVISGDDEEPVVGASVTVVGTNWAQTQTSTENSSSQTCHRVQNHFA